MNSEEFTEKLFQAQDLMEKEKYKEAIVILNELKEIDKTGMFEYSLTHKLYQLLSNSQSLYNQQVILSLVKPLSKKQKTISLKEISQKLEKEKNLHLKDDILLREIELLVLRNLLPCRIDRDKLQF